MEFIFKHFWIAFIAITIINGLVFKFRSQQYITKNAQLKGGYDKLIRGWLIYMNIPWIIMAIGDLSGLTNNTFEYLNPRSLNPIVLVFHTSIIVLWILSVRWIYFRNGAEILQSHPGLLRKTGFSGNSDVTAKQIKIFFPLMLLGGILGMIMMWVMDVQPPPF